MNIVDLSFFNCFPWNIYGSSRGNIYISFWASMCSTFSLLVIEWKLCAHTTSDVRTSKRTQRYTILACCWYQWCEYCQFVIFQLFFLKYLCKAQKAMFTSVFLSFDVFYFLSFGCRVETVRTHYKRRTNITTYTTSYYISVLLVSLVWILLICHFSTVFPEIWWTFSLKYLRLFSWAYINFEFCSNRL